MRKRATAIIIRDKKLLVIHRQKFGRDYYTLPGGGVELEESFQEACIREVKEETGLGVISVRLFRKFYSFEREEAYFIVQVTPGEPALTAGPELERQSPDNRYSFEWVDAVRLKEINLMPEASRRISLEVAQEVMCPPDS